jgi:hypothetical protein
MLMSVEKATSGQGLHRRNVRFVLSFSVPLNPAVAQNPALYTVIHRGPRGFHPRRIPVLAAEYDPGESAVILKLRKPPAPGFKTLTIQGVVAAGVPAPTIVTRL